MVNGPGWLAVQDASGREAYTRNGDLRLDPAGQLHTASGLAVLGDGGPISVPPNSSLAIAADGSISIVPLGQSPTTTAIVGRIKLVNPPAAELEREARTACFGQRDGTPIAPSDATVQLGEPERSKLATSTWVETMTNMIETGAPLRPAGQGHRTG